MDQNHWTRLVVVGGNVGERLALVSYSHRTLLGAELKG